MNETIAYFPFCDEMIWSQISYSATIRLQWEHTEETSQIKQPPGSLPSNWAPSASPLIYCFMNLLLSSLSSLNYPRAVTDIHSFNKYLMNTKDVPGSNNYYLSHSTYCAHTGLSKLHYVFSVCFGRRTRDRIYEQPHGKHSTEALIQCLFQQTFIERSLCSQPFNCIKAFCGGRHPYFIKEESEVQRDQFPKSHR